MITPSAIPQIPGDMDTLETQGRAFRTQGNALTTTGADIDSTWQGLTPVYKAPEAAALFAVTAPVRTTAASVGTDFGSVGDALVAYANTVRPIQARLLSLQSQAQAFVNQNSGDSHWTKDGDKVNKNNQMIKDVDAAVAEWMAAQRTCANSIDALYGGTQYTQDDGKGKPSSNEFGYSASQLDSAANAKGGLPWGKPSKRDKPWYEDAWDDVVSFGKGVFVDGLWGTIKGLGTLVGFGGWDKMKNSWIGLEKLSLALNPILLTVNMVTPLPFLKRNELGNTLLNTGKSLISWDEWSKDPGRAAGSTIFNVITAVGTDGAGAAVDATGDAAKVADAASVAGDAGKVSRVADAAKAADEASLASKMAGYAGKGLNSLDQLQHVVTGMPKVSDIATAVAKIPGIKVPDLLHDGAPGLHDAAPVHDAVPSREPALVGAGGHGGGDTTHLPGIHDPGVGGSHDSGASGSHDPGASGSHDGSTPSGSHDGSTPTDHGGSTGHDGTPTSGHDGTPPHTPPHTPVSYAHDPNMTTAEKLAAAQHEISVGAKDFPSNIDAEKYGETHWNDYAEHLPPAEKEALHDYTEEPPAVGAPADHPSYVEIDGQLRGSVAADPVVTSHITEIDKALAGTPLPDDVIVTRGSGISHLPATPDKLIGKTLSDDAYMSSSLGGPAAAFDAKQAIFHLHVPKGTPALYVEKVSAFGNEERELLLGRGLHITITDAIMKGGQWQIYGEVF